MHGGWTYTLGLPPTSCLSPFPTALWGSSCRNPHHQINHLALSGTVNKASPYHCGHCPRQIPCDCARKGTILPASNLLCTVCTLMSISSELGKLSSVWVIPLRCMPVCSWRINKNFVLWPQKLYFNELLKSQSFLLQYEVSCIALQWDSCL